MEARQGLSRDEGTEMAYKIDRLVSSKNVVSWRVRWRYSGKADGAFQSVTLHSETDAKLLKAKVESLRHLITRDDPRIVDRSIITGKVLAQPVDTDGLLWEEVAALWRATRTARPQTLKGHQQVLDNHLNRWDGRLIKSLTRTDVVALVNDHHITKSGQGRTLLTVARAILRFAVSEGYRADDPAHKIPLHPGTAKISMFLESDEVPLLLSASERVPFANAQKRWPVFVQIALGTGLRLSEINALRVSDLSLTRGRARLTVERAWRPVPGEGCQITPPKSKSCLRTVAITDDLADALVEYTRDLARSAYLFPGQDQRNPMNPRTLRRWWVETVELAADQGLVRRPRFHDLRHTHASDLLAGGVSMMIVSRRLGHESIIVTDDYYGHLSTDSDDVVRAAMSRPRETVPRLRAV